MNCKVEKTENANEVKLEITVEAEKFENAIKKVYFQNAKYINIPGFRKGKAPMNIVEKYYGAQIFYEDAFNDVATQSYGEALDENNLEVVSKPVVDIVQMEKGKDLIFTAVVQIKPEVELGKYKGIALKKVEYKVEKEDIEKELKQMQDRNSRLVTVDDRALENGDISTIDFEGFVDGVAFEGGKAEGHELEIGSGAFIPGFEEHLIGMKIDEEREIEVTFPKEYFSKDLAGKDATFKVKLHEIKKKELPKLDDEFAKDVSEVEHMMQDFSQRLAYQGLNMEQYLKMMGKTEEEIKKDYEPQAIEALKSRLTLEAIRKAEKIEASEEEINEKLEEMAKNYGKKVEDIKDNENLKNYIKEGIEAEKSIDFIVKNAKIK